MTATVELVPERGGLLGGRMPWRRLAGCRDAPPELFVTDTEGDEDDEPDYATAEHRAYCDPCPVREACLAWALERGERGVWGGTTTYQRRLIERRFTRTVCPGCASDDVIRENGHQVCLACGLSWRAA